MDRTELQARLTFRKAALEKLRAAFLALIDGGVKSYTIDDRTLTGFDIDKLRAEIQSLESDVDTLQSQLAGKRARKAFAIVPRNW
jgi:hypothetical protein